MADVGVSEFMMQKSLQRGCRINGHRSGLAIHGETYDYAGAFRLRHSQEPRPMSRAFRPRPADAGIHQPADRVSRKGPRRLPALRFPEWFPGWNFVPATRRQSSAAKLV